MKPKKVRIARPVSDLKDALREQILLLHSHCEHYDSGERAFAKPMASTLRLLIHQTGMSTSLLQQLNLRSGRFYTVAPRVDYDNLVPECNLVAMRFDAGVGASYVPRLVPLAFKDRLPFAEWWLEPVVKGVNNATMSRKDIITAVAEMDGGSHVDAGLEKLYASFRSGELLGWLYRIGTQDATVSIPIGVQTSDAPEESGDYIAAPQYACIRSIAHEFLLTMGKYAPWSVSKPYQPPLIDA